MNPLVSVICISYNHAPFISEALNSVFKQIHTEIQVIIMDDGSTDNSVTEIEKLVLDKPEITFITNTKNEGYTRTFNKGLALAKGDYIVDFSLDDVMHPDFLSESVKRLEMVGGEYGVSFCNADYINQSSTVVGNHNDILRSKMLIQEIPQGDVFEMVLKRYFICTPTMVIRKPVFDRMGGYDEDLAYEDFDFWVRSSRHYHYTYIDKGLMQKRKLKTSMSAMRYRHKENDQMLSIFKVCEKAFQLCKTASELKALNLRLAYEHRQCIRNGAFELADKYFALAKTAKGNLLKIKITELLIRIGIDRKAF
ncbi:glycosyltransferase family 2 protein [Roseivirga echinicomitans]